MDAATIAGFVEMLKVIGEWGAGPLFLLAPFLFCVAGLVFCARCFRSLERTMIEGLAKIEVIAQSMADKYESNARLVEETQRVARQSQAQTDTLIQVLRDNTAALTLLAERIAGINR